MGDAIASGIWTGKTMVYMREECPPATSKKTLKEIYGSIQILRSGYDWNDPTRKGAIEAYKRTNGIIFITATVLAALPVLFSLCMPSKLLPVLSWRPRYTYAQDLQATTWASSKMQ